MKAPGQACTRPQLPPAPDWPAAALHTNRGHKIKNPKMQLRQRLDQVPVRMRLIVSGTPIQNNLSEMWALFNFACEVCGGEGAGTEALVWQQ